MKISHRLLALSGVSAAGLACVAAVSFWAVTTIQGDLQGLTLQAGPLQARTLELQERTERLMGSLLRLSLAREGAEVERIGQSVAADLGAIDKLRGEIRQLDPKAGADNADFRAAQAQIGQAAQQRLADESGYRKESEAARAALAKAETAVAETRSAVGRIGTEAGQAADKAQDQLRRQNQSIKLALIAQARLKDVALVVAEIDAATNRFRLTPMKERAKAALDSIGRLEVEAGGEDHLKDVRATGVKLWDAIARDNDGLLAQRAKVLAKAEGAEAAYAAQRKAVLGPMDDQTTRLGALIDGIEVQAVKQRQVLEAALKLRNEPGGVVTTSEEVALAIRDMVANLRGLMLAATTADADSAAGALRAEGVKLTKAMQSMRAGLVKMNRPALVVQVDAALAAMAQVGGALDKVASTKQRVLASEAAMAQSLAALKETAARQAASGERQIKSVAERQAAVTAAVDDRVRSSIVVILGIAVAIVLVIGGLSLHTVRIVTRRLNAAVAVTEQVSQGSLADVPDEGGSDETARLMAALAKMVGTLRGIVVEIQGASQRIDQGTRELGQGNSDLSTRTEQQAAQLQQTAASVEELAATVGQNAESARSADALASQAREVAGRGGEIVAGVVQTMSGIQQQSRKIAEIIGVIDGIAFQTNILALNAAVEAARAGEHGRGFAVVAQEVRALAGKSAEAASQVKAIVGTSVQGIETGSQQVRDAGQVMDGIVQQVTQVSELVAQIAQASQQQATSVATVNEAVSQIDEMTQRNAALAEQGSAAAESLRQQAQALTRSIAVFRQEA